MLIDIQTIQNPVIDIPGWAVKDACVTRHNGYFYVFASAFYFEDGMERSHLFGLKLKHFGETGEILFCTYGKELDAYGLCSPDINAFDGVFYLSYNTWGNKPGSPNRLLYATSTDLEHWQFHKPLAPKTTLGKRAIDAVLAFYNKKIYLCWKEFQQMKFAWSDDIDAPAWNVIPEKLDAWYENGQFIQIDGQWHVLATGCFMDQGVLKRRPYLLTMVGDPREDASWGHWKTDRMLVVPTQAYNTSELANAAYLMDYRDTDGYFYLFSAGTVDQPLHANRGDCRMGLAWSKDLVTWQANP